MITNVKKEQSMMSAIVTGDAVALAVKSKGFQLSVKTDKYYFWSKEWKTFLSLARKAKIEVIR